MSIRNHAQNLHERMPRAAELRTIVLIGAALGGGLTESAQAAEHVPVNPEAAAMHHLNRDLANEVPIQVDYQHDVLWSGPNQPKDQYQYRTALPLMAEVNGETRYFKVTQKGTDLDTLRVAILPKDATVVVNNVSETPNDVIKEHASPAYQFRKIKLNDADQPTLRRRTPAYGLQKLTVGATTTMPGQDAPDFGGKRFASTAMTGSLESAQTGRDAAYVLQTFFKQYNIKVNIGDPAGRDRVISSSDFVNNPISEAALTKLKIAGAIAIDEFSKYPLTLVENIHMRAISFVDGMNSETRGGASGLYVNPNIGISVQGLDEQGLNGRSLDYLKDWFRKAMHHEVGHGANAMSALDINQPWQALNPAEFKYDAANPACARLAEFCTANQVSVGTFDGFVTNYAATNVGEDIAEVAGYDLTAESSKQLTEWSKTDTVLAQKRALVRQMFSELSDGEMNDAYYAAVNP